MKKQTHLQNCVSEPTWWQLATLEEGSGSIKLEAPLIKEDASIVLLFQSIQKLVKDFLTLLGCQPCEITNLTNNVHAL